MSDSPLLEVRELSVGFRGEGRKERILAAVERVSFSVAAGETLALLGESGCGKSAAALALMRLLPEAGVLIGGSVRFAGEELTQLPETEMRRHRGARMAMIFQEPATSLNPVLTVGQQIAEVLACHSPDLGRAARAERACELLAAVGIADPRRRIDEYPFQLSGGMKQRVMIAIALAGDPRLLIADEPTTALDVTVQAQILDLLSHLQEERGMGILLITHDLGVVARMAHRVGVMYAGEIVEEAPRERFFRAPQHPYTHKLFAALPRLERRGQALETIPGQVPPLAALGAFSGCRFAPRCPHAASRCREENPAWHQAAEGHRLRCHWVEGGKTLSPLTAPALRVTSLSVGEVKHPPLPQPLSPGGRGAGGEGEGSPPTEIPLSAPETLLALDGLRVHFPIHGGLLRRKIATVRAVDGVSFSLERGKTLALVGESGCGKTTVGKAILQLVAPSGGSVRLSGRELATMPPRQLRPLRRKMQMVFQDPFASLNPRLPVGEIVAEGIHALNPGQAEDVDAVLAALLEQVGLEREALRRYPHEFSGGQRQRIAIARALAVEPELLICDEPTSALDVSVQAQILNLLRELQQRLGLAYLFITHNFAVVEHLAHEVAVMYLGRIVEHGGVAEILNAPRHPYTQALLSAVLSPDDSLESGEPQRIRLPGETPSPARPPTGCHFHPRCPKADSLCREQYPAATIIGAGHSVCCHRC
ncbi:MAG: ABC transporter ATP-binding protein [Betaproteobacteria bacterium]|nr:ABC transporter ATP-binding protein [Betaproteobacteria bacterium]